MKTGYLEAALLLAACCAITAAGLALLSGRAVCVGISALAGAVVGFVVCGLCAHAHQ